jgi:hypothetical protein
VVLYIFVIVVYSNRLAVCDFALERLDPKQPLSVVCFQELAYYVSDSFLRERVIDGILNGFNTHYEGPTNAFVDLSINLPHKDISRLRKKLVVGAQKGRVFGPFPRPPFPTPSCPDVQPFVIRRFLIPKDKWHPFDGQVREIDDGTANGLGVNPWTGRHDSGHKYYSLHNFLEKLTRCGANTLVFLFDIREAFKKIIWSRDCWHQQVVRMTDTEFYIDCSGLFGTKAANDSWNCVAVFARDGAREFLRLDFLDVYVDNYDNETPPVTPGGPPNWERARTDADALLNLFGKLFGRSEIHEVVGPGLSGKHLGLLFNTQDMSVHITQEKRALMIEQIDRVLAMARIPIGILSSLIGLALFLSYVLFVLRGLAGHLIQVRTSCQRKSKITAESTTRIRHTLKLAKYFLTHWLGRSLLLQPDWVSDDVLLWADSCCKKAPIRWGKGCFNESTGEFYAQPWSDEHCTWAMRKQTEAAAYLELLNYAIAVVTFAKPGSRLLVLGDCEPMINIANNAYTTNAANRAVLDSLAVWCARNSVSVRFRFVEGSSNVLADHLSRGKIQAFHDERGQASCRVTPHGFTPLSL